MISEIMKSIDLGYQLMIHYKLFNLNTVNKINLINTVNFVNIAIRIIFLILMTIFKNSLELNNWLMLILITNGSLIPYFNFYFEINNDLSMIKSHSSEVFVLILS